MSEDNDCCLVEVSPGKSDRCIVDVCLSDSFPFVLPTMQWSKDVGTQIGLDYINTILPIQQQDPVLYPLNQKPLLLYDVCKDGNCFFRSLNHETTGIDSEDGHKYMRTLILDYINNIYGCRPISKPMWEKFENSYTGPFKMSHEEYLELCKQKGWATIEVIRAAATYFNISIFTFTPTMPIARNNPVPENAECVWKEIRPININHNPRLKQQISSRFSKCPGAIYLYHENANHYRPVYHMKAEDLPKHLEIQVRYSFPIRCP